MRKDHRSGPPKVPRDDAIRDMTERWMSAPPFNKAFAYEVTERSDRTYEEKVTGCLPAKIWREMKAADLGYALECSSADAQAKAFNPGMKATFIKNMLKGDGFCLVRYEMI